MIALLWAALISVALVAASAFGLVLVLARRLRAVAERVERFLPISEGSLPDPGTPVPEFAALAVDGTRVSHEDLAGPDRVLAFLTTDCASCRDQVPALRELDHSTWAAPIVVVIGSREQRSDMVAALADRAVVIEEEDHGPIAGSFDIHEFPAVVLSGLGVIHRAAHGLTGALAAARQTAPT
jgi:peroxiredoxin